MPPPAQARPVEKNSILASVIGKAGAVCTLLGLSLVVFTYRRSLTPLYGSVPTELHLNKVVWIACIIGSFAPTVSISYAAFAAGVLLCLMPNSAYWAAVYTGRMGDPVWGPVVVHIMVLLPVLALGVAIVKALQQTTDQQENAAPQQLITLPVAQTSIMTLQDLWPVFSRLRSVPESQVILYVGSLILVIWTISPLLYSPVETSNASNTTVPDSSPAVIVTQKGKPKHKRKPSSTKAITKPAGPSSPVPVSVSPSSPQTRTKTSSNQSLMRLILLPLIPMLVSTILQPPTLPKPLGEPYLHPAYPLRIISSVRSSYSGVVLVGEVLPPIGDKPALGAVHSLRYLRAGHSLLGGAWIGEAAILGRHDSDPVGLDEAGEPVGDSMYHAFMLQDAARLFEREGGKKRENALVIGLGTGVAASSLIRSNVSTTIVEIDPAVYEAARRFFAFPEPGPGKVFIKDARTWVREHRRERESATRLGDQAGHADETEPNMFDIVLHDVFTGGTMPSHVFTQQFWNDTKALMSSDGILAVNFAGQLDSEPARAIIMTLLSTFDTCRAFCDEVSPDEQAKSEFHNWVFFCSPSSALLTLRAPRSSDYFGSVQRAQILNTLQQREFDLKSVTEDILEEQRDQYILTDARNPLGKWQEKEALSHWRIMREVFPDAVWETY